MRKLTFLLTVLLLTAPVFSQAAKPGEPAAGTAKKDPVVREEVKDSGNNLKEVIYKQGNVEVAKEEYLPNGQFNKKTGKIPDGIVLQFYRRNLVMRELNYTDGKLNGICKTYYRSKSIYKEENYKNGKLDGASKTYDDKGILMTEIYFKEDRQEGMTKIFYKNGKIKSESDYKAGKMISNKTYTDKGEITAEEYFKDEKYEGRCRTFYKNGKIKTDGNYVSSNPVEIKYYFESGILFASEKFMYNEKSRHKIGFNTLEIDHTNLMAEAGTKADGTTVISNKEGKKAAEWTFKNGKPDGVCKIYYENGSPWLELGFVEGILEGACKWMYEKEGVIKNELTYKANMLDGPGKWYYEDAKLSQEQNYKAGEREGSCKIYYNSGNLRGDFTFARGVLNGKSVYSWDIEGSVKFQDVYESNKLTSRVKRAPNYEVISGNFMEEEY